MEPLDELKPPGAPSQRRCRGALVFHFSVCWYVMRQIIKIIPYHLIKWLSDSFSSRSIACSVRWCFCFRQTKTQWAIPLIRSPETKCLRSFGWLFLPVFGSSAFFLPSFITFSFVPRTLVSRRNLFCTGYLLSRYAKLEMRISVVINRCHRFSTWNLFSVLMLEAARRGKGERKREWTRKNGNKRTEQKRRNTTEEKKIFEFSSFFSPFSKSFDRHHCCNFISSLRSNVIFASSRSVLAFRVDIFQVTKSQRMKTEKMKLHWKWNENYCQSGICY